jgi:redox-sensing transcriptional repressor
LSYFSFQHPGLSIVAAFDSDENKTNRVIAGCRCFHVRDLSEKVKELGATIGVVTVPAQHAQEAADMMVEAGIKGILNFAPVPLKLPEDVFNDRIDISMALEKIAYFAD